MVDKRATARREEKVVMSFIVFLFVFGFTFFLLGSALSLDWVQVIDLIIMAWFHDPDGYFVLNTITHEFFKADAPTSLNFV